MAQNENIKLKKNCLLMENLRKFEFMHQYMNEIEIFNFGSSKFKEFIIHCIINMQTEFTYLSFLSGDDVDQELLKVLGILQVVPAHSFKKNGNMFQNWSDTDIQKFWTKFFSLCEILNNEKHDFHHSLILDSKINFMKDINSLLQYLNYDFPVCNSKKLSSISVNDEILKWNDELDLESKTAIEQIPIGECEDESLFEMNIQKLITDLKHIVTTYNQIKCETPQPESNDSKLFKNLIGLTEDVIKYNKSCEVIQLESLKKILNEYLRVKENKKSCNDLYFLKTYDNFINNLKSKINLYF